MRNFKEIIQICLKNLVMNSKILKLKFTALIKIKVKQILNECMNIKILLIKK